MDSVLFSNNVFNYLEVIKNELYFNKQYLHLENEVYIRQENIDKKNYKEFKEIFEGNYIGNGNYFHLVWNDSGEIIIRYFSENKGLFKNIFKV